MNISATAVTIVCEAVGCLVIALDLMVVAFHACPDLTARVLRGSTWLSRTRAKSLCARTCQNQSLGSSPASKSSSQILCMTLCMTQGGFRNLWDIKSHCSSKLISQSNLKQLHLLCCCGNQLLPPLSQDGLGGMALRFQFPW